LRGRAKRPKVEAARRLQTRPIKVKHNLKKKKFLLSKNNKVYLRRQALVFRRRKKLKVRKKLFSFRSKVLFFLGLLQVGFVSDKTKRIRRVGFLKKRKTLNRLFDFFVFSRLRFFGNSIRKGGGIIFDSAIFFLKKVQVFVHLQK
jgi:hypothetical protein